MTGKRFSGGRQRHVRFSLLRNRPALARPLHQSPSADLRARDLRFIDLKQQREAF